MNFMNWKWDDGDIVQSEREVGRWDGAEKVGR